MCTWLISCSQLTWLTMAIVTFNYHEVHEASAEVLFGDLLSRMIVLINQTRLQPAVSWG